jgi:hypothetical protein
MQPTHFHITSHCNGVLVGTSVSSSAECFIAHLLAIHARTSNIELTVYPYDGDRHHFRGPDGRLYPLFLYRSSAEAQLTAAQFSDLVHDYAHGRAGVGAQACLQAA